MHLTRVLMVIPEAGGDEGAPGADRVGQRQVGYSGQPVCGGLEAG